MPINVRNNKGRCMIRLKCPITGTYKSYTAGSYYDPISKHRMSGIAMAIDYALAKYEWTGSISDYMPEFGYEKQVSLLDLLKQRSKGDDKSIYMTLWRKLSGKAPIDSAEKCKRWLEKLEISNASYNRYRSVIGALRPDLVVSTRPKKADGGDPKPFNVDEQKRLLSALSDGVNDIIVRLWLKTGLRNGEISALSCLTISLSNGNACVQVNRSYTKGVMKNVPKNGKRRVVQITKADYELWRQPLLNDDECFRNINWDSWIRNYWKPLLKKAGIEYRKPYCLRHTAISNYLFAGHSSADACKTFGTSLAMIEKHYLGAVNLTPHV
jgi:integrase